jgi:glycosyltransferase involved in cell wall biosynthesis
MQGISVVIPTFNSARTVCGTIDALLAQDYPKRHYEVIVADDASADGTAAMLERRYGKRIRLLKFKTNSGPAAARNAGAAAAKHGIVAFTDSDCVPDKNWLRNAARHFEDNRILGLGGITTTDANKSYLAHYAENATDSGFYPTCNAFYRKAALRRAGWFDETLKTAYLEDTDLALRIAKHGRVKFAGDVRVLHPSSPITLLSRLDKEAKFHAYDSLYFKKHPEFFRKKFMLFWRIRKGALGLAVPASLLVAIAAQQLAPWLLAYLAGVLLYFHRRRLRIDAKNFAAALATLWLLPVLKEIAVLRGVSRYKTFVF